MLTLIIIAVTCIFSIIAFSKRSLIHKYQFNAYQILKRKQYPRLLLHAFLHANWTHLIINMLVLYSFGRELESLFQLYFTSTWVPFYLLLYFGAILVSPVYSLYRNRNNYNYNAVGASGAVSAVVFATIFFDPWRKIYFFMMVPMPGIVFAILYLLYSWIMSRRASDNIAHDTHFFGALYGFVLPALLSPNLFLEFIRQLLRQ